MGQAKRRGTPDERRELAIAWAEAHREDSKRFPPPPPPRVYSEKHGWMTIAAALALLSTPRR
jgi:hypothetical protein